MRLNDSQLETLATKYDVGNVPGYLSYPVIAHWRQHIRASDVVELCHREVQSANGSAYLYFHFPYCQTLCYYCACFMKVTGKPQSRYDTYIEALESELEMKFAAAGGRLRTGEMHWGGGTPTYMSSSQMERIFRRIERWVEWTAAPTVSIEAYPDPDMLTSEKLHTLAALGFNQLSLGVESLDPKVMKAINRNHDEHALRTLVDTARSIGFSIHLDVVYGLPYQTEANIADTVETLVSLKPDRLAAFPFTYNPFEIPHQRAIPRDAVPSCKERIRLFETLDGLATASSYERVGCDHYVLGARDALAAAHRQGEVIFHFQGYEPVSRQTFLGFGNAAVSFVRDRYFQNERDVGVYLSRLGQGHLAVNEGASALLDADDRIRHRLILKGILCDLHVDKAAVERQFGIPFDTYFAKECGVLQTMEDDDLVTGVDTDRIAVTPTGRSFIRNICHAFDRYYAAD